MKQRRIEWMIVSHLFGIVPALWLKWLTGARLVIDEHNVEYDVMRQSGSRWWRLLWMLEWLACRMADRIWCVSQDDKARLVRHLGIQAGKIQVVPNGVDEGLRTPAAVGRVDHPMALFFGVLNYAPNAAAVDVIRRELLLRLGGLPDNCSLVVAGIGGETLQGEGPVRFTGFVTDIHALVRQAAVVIVPLLSGGGTRLKILESIALQTPVITTPAGAEGLDPQLMGAGLRIVDTWDDFPTAMRDALSRPTCIEPPPAFWNAYSWKRIFERALEGTP